jgi:hypothetical protein
MKYGLNGINIQLFTQWMWWLGGKGIELHPWGLKIKLHKWLSLWSTLEYWLNILYLLWLPRLVVTCLKNWYDENIEKNISYYLNYV